MPWVQLFAVLLVSHLVGDYLVQTNWQAAHKFAGLGPDPVARAALLAHVATYTLCFMPALVWLGEDAGGCLLLLAALAVPHLVQDDGRLLDLYLRHVKRCDAQTLPALRAPVDQVLHVVVLFAVALVAGV